MEYSGKNRAIATTLINYSAIVDLLRIAVCVDVSVADSVD